MATTKELDVLVDWLRDAYGMEKQAEEMLEKQERRLGDFPEMQRKVHDHLETTHIQADRVKSCLQQLGTDTSAIKTGMGKLAGTIGALTGMAASDEPVKGHIADFAFENFEIACYKSLIACAEDCGELQVAEACRQSLREEEDMASFLNERLPTMTTQFLHMHTARA